MLHDLFAETFPQVISNLLGGQGAAGKVQPDPADRITVEDDETMSSRLQHPVVLTPGLNLG